jgi:hypothetical protein
LAFASLLIIAVAGSQSASFDPSRVDSDSYPVNGKHRERHRACADPENEKQLYKFSWPDCLSTTMITVGEHAKQRQTDA